jgi:hypothetical protein
MAVENIMIAYTVMLSHLSFYFTMQKATLQHTSFDDILMLQAMPDNT